MTKIAVVTGAGSGVGQAVAIDLLKSGWNVALMGRRKSSLEETVKQAGHHAGTALVVDCDISKSDAVQKAGETILAKFGAVDALINAAGTNNPQRSLAVLSLVNYHDMIDTNLNGAYYCVQAFLPTMRNRKSGTIINIVSEAGIQASPKAGPAYVMSKFGMAGLTQAINAEEKPHGIRACSIFPGDIDTPLLEKRPSPPPAEARTRMLRSEDLAACVKLVLDLPARAAVEEILIRPG